MFLRLAIILILVSTSAGSTELNDGHIHYNQDIWEKLKPEEALRLLEENNIQRAIVSSTPTAGTEKLFKLAADKVIPFLRPYRNIRDRYTWHSDPSIIDYIKQQLDKNFYKGFGEFHLFHDHKDTKVILEIMQLVAQHKLVLSAHSDASTIETLINMQPELTIIWAHCGMDQPIKDIRHMLEQYQNLYCELSFRDGITDDSGMLSSEWKTLLETFPDRFITGSDTYIPRRWANLPELTEFTHGWLMQLSPRTANAIARDNINRLFPTTDDKQQ